MRLLNVHNLRIESRDPSAQIYAILSHTWGDEEVTFQEFQDAGKHSKKGYKKILDCCSQAREDGIDWVWVDTCCIDKTSSAELSEAINSMYAWYQGSAVCYVFLEEVPPLAPHFPEAEFRKARWFTRGWCLQELIAPVKVDFFAKDWTDIGTRWSLEETITEVTGIPGTAFDEGVSLRRFSIAQKMSWASQRKTSRKEDEAYCLLGIFNINMPLIYGEGVNAFRRLLSEILKKHEDYSFLLWTTAAAYLHDSFPPVALKPEFFQRHGLSTWNGETCAYQEIKFARGLPDLASRNPPQLTSRGLQVEMLVHPNPDAFLKDDDGEPVLDDTMLLVFTEFMYRDKLVCIALDKDGWGGRHSPMFWRSFSNQVFLVEAEPMGEPYELRKLYLAAHHIYEWSEVEPLRKPPGLRLHLSSKCGSATINFMRSIPQIQFSIPGQPPTYNPPPWSRLECLMPDFPDSGWDNLLLQFKLSYLIKSVI
ncbi:heterokaryon incompatibility protein-domain-containing protein [Fusarium solani]|uniref:Heterokaryon incompatibility protein-domain-containing protein n=1 Tax=Fusarium solani TaxID=169388 RepID=A0A9P9GMC5_FUSSL|nr:heterokaryon incompatibility protein-domain-containing protein [Fusarium solani]KAH7240517.1 heterokaryon incompatibility protein-domain-containing protein [Fusarium solani]